MRRKARRTAPRRPCRHPQQYETDWLGRTYVGCPSCNRWKLTKPKPAPADGKRLAAGTSTGVRTSGPDPCVFTRPWVWLPLFGEQCPGGLGFERLREQEPLP